MSNSLFGDDLPFDVPSAPAPAPKAVTNLKSLAFELRDTLISELEGLLGAAEADVKNFASEIAPILVSAAANGDHKLAGELEAQVRGIAEINRIRASSAAWRTVRAVSSIALKAVSIGLSALTHGLVDLRGAVEGPQSVVGRVSRP